MDRVRARGESRQDGGGVRIRPIARSLSAPRRTSRTASCHGSNPIFRFLATTGNITPFIGLLGTVMGIIDAFREIGTQGTASIAAVAPGVAEALVATAAGLFTAIPAVIAYNYFLTGFAAPRFGWTPSPSSL